MLRLPTHSKNSKSVFKKHIQLRAHSIYACNSFIVKILYKKLQSNTIDFFKLNETKALLITHRCRSSPGLF